MNTKKPYIEIKTSETACWEGWAAITTAITDTIKIMNQPKVVVVVESFHGTYGELNLNAIKAGIQPDMSCSSADSFHEESVIRQMVRQDIREDKWRARKTLNGIDDYFDTEKLEAIRLHIDSLKTGVVLIHGVGAYHVYPADLLIYSDMSNWEIIQRFRGNDISNVGVENMEDDYYRQYFWSHFVDEHICNQIKKRLVGLADYFLETNNWQKPILVSGTTIRDALKKAASQPLFMAPFYDPRLWDNEKHQYKKMEKEASSLTFDCHVQSNNLLFKIDKYLFEIPVMNLIYYQPAAFLGAALLARYGTDLPLRVEFLDRLDAKINRLSIYPDASFISENFGIHLVQNDNYYVVEAAPKALLFAGFKNNKSHPDFIEKIKKKNFKWSEAYNFLRRIKIKKHDHFNIPAGIIHNSGQKSILLRIHTAPTIFEYQITGRRNLQKENKSRQQQLADLTLSDTGSRIFFNQNQKTNAAYDAETLFPNVNNQLDIQRIRITAPVTISTGDQLQVLNLLEGNQLTIRSAQAHFSDTVVRKYETLVLPAQVGKVLLVPDKGEKVCFLKTTMKC